MRTETFDELSQRLAADPPSHCSNSGSWNLQAHRRWERLQAETAVKWLLAHAAPGPNRDDVEQVVVRLGRGWGPYVLDVLQTAGALTADTATLAGPIWGMAEYPEGRGGMTRASWLSVFAVTGYTVDGMRAERPGSPVRLYRGAPPSADLAWRGLMILQPRSDLPVENCAAARPARCGRPMSHRNVSSPVSTKVVGVSRST
jgi:hypothetical protein